MRSRIPGMDYCLNPYTGCVHGCVYCYACFMKRFSGVERRWGTFVKVKANLPERLASQLRRPKQGRVMLASVTDAYQPLEKQYRLTRACLEELADHGLAVCILTKSNLVVRDVDVLRRMLRLEVGFSLTVADDAVARLLEPGAPPPSRRLEAMKKLADSGVRTWAFIAPVIPGLGDTLQNLEDLLRRVVATGTRDVCYDPLNFYPSAVANLQGFLASRFPQYLGAFRQALRDPLSFRSRLEALAAQLWAAYGLQDKFHSP